MYIGSWPKYCHDWSFIVKYFSAPQYTIPLFFVDEFINTLHGVGCVTDDKIFYLLFDLHIYAHFKC